MNKPEIFLDTEVSLFQVEERFFRGNTEVDRVSKIFGKNLVATGYMTYLALRGTFVHNLMEEWLKNKGNIEYEPFDRSELLDRIMEAYHKFYYGLFPKSREEIRKELYLQARYFKGCVSSYLKDGWEIAYFKGKPLVEQRLVYHSSHDRWVTGTFDAVLHKNGVYLLLDYKGMDSESHNILSKVYTYFLSLCFPGKKIKSEYINASQKDRMVCFSEEDIWWLVGDSMLDVSI